MKPIIAAAMFTLAGAGLAAADAPPPADAQPLSAILGIVEAEHDIAYVDEVSWEDDGYWEVEVYLTAGGELELRIDPVTGETLR
jgi:hypothetical protein